MFKRLRDALPSGVCNDMCSHVFEFGTIRRVDLDFNRKKGKNIPQVQAVSRRPAASIDVRFHNWLEEMDAWTALNQNPNVTYMQMKDHPTQKAVMEEITSIHEEVQDPSKVEKMAATLFKYAYVRLACIQLL